MQLAEAAADTAGNRDAEDRPRPCGGGDASRRLAKDGLGVEAAHAGQHQLGARELLRQLHEFKDEIDAAAQFRTQERAQSSA